MTAGRRSPTQALVELFTDPRELGYEESARRHGGRPPRHLYDRPVIVLTCLVLGFVLAVAWVHVNRGAPTAAKVHAGLVKRARAAQGDVQSLTSTETALDAELQKVRVAALAGSSGLLRQLSLSQIDAGSAAVTGPGVEVRLSEPTVAAQPTTLPGAGARTPASGGHVLTQRDLRSVVNQLWSDGAEAIAVNGIRLTATSAIRFAGDAVLVDFQPINSPYAVDAIGNSNALVTAFAASDVASRYQTLAGAEGIGFSFREERSLELPAGPAATLRYAHLAKGR